jgi:epoxyqueuosine reductase
LIGCLTCQLICPQNKNFLPGSQDGAVFSQEETAWLLRRISLDRLPVALAEKIVQFDLVDYLEILPRNVPVLLKKTEVNPAAQQEDD